MNHNELFLQLLIENDEPLTLIEFYDLIYYPGNRATPEVQNRRSKVIVMAQSLNRLCKEKKLISFKPPHRNIYYLLPEWCSNAKLKQLYQYKLDNKLSRMITIGLVDDQILFRKALKELLPTLADIDITVEADNGNVFLEKIRQESSIPHICILSSTAIMLNDNQTLKNIKKHAKDIRVLVIVPYDNEFTLCKMINDGANGYLAWDCQPEQLKDAILTLHKQKFYIDNIPANTWDEINNFSKRFSISERQQQFLELSAKDLSYDEIAKIMGKSVRTVETYRDALFQNYGIHNRVSLNMFAIKNGIIEFNK